MKHQRCSKCQQTKPYTDFHKDRSHTTGIQRYCKSCKKRVDVHGLKKDEGKFFIYYLPKERYIGMTKNFKKRVKKHEVRGKNVKYAFVVLSTRKMKLAHLIETMFHMFGFNGFRY